MSSLNTQYLNDAYTAIKKEGAFKMTLTKVDRIAAFIMYDVLSCMFDVCFWFHLFKGDDCLD